MKILFSSALILIAFPTFAAEITSPFYMPQAGHLLSKTSATYTKNKVKATPTLRTYHQSLGEQIVLGLGAGLAAVLDGNLNWSRQKQDSSISFPHTKGYGAGLKGTWEFETFLTQISAIYHQTTNVHFKPRREIEAHLHVGKSLKTMTPYLHLSTEFPLNARSEKNDPVYRAETGVFQAINKSMTLDTALYLQYDKNIKERSYGIRTEWSYLITSEIAFSLNGEWQARGHAKKNTSTYHKSIGTKITFSF